jgi:hypothetical protein
LLPDSPGSAAVRRLVRRFAVALVLFGVAGGAGAQEGWRTYSNPNLGTRVEFPADLFSVAEGRPEQGSGVRFRTADGRARLSIYSLRNEQGLTPATWLRTNLQVPRQSLYYQRIAPTFFAISANHQNLIYYSRCNFVQSVIHCIYVIYPREQKRAFDPIVTRISRTLRPL